MDAMQYHALSLVALANGIGIFFGAMGRRDPAPSTRVLAGMTAFTCAAWVAAYALTRYEHPLWAFAVALFPSSICTASWRDTLNQRVSGRVLRGLWLAALGAASAGVYFSQQAAEHWEAEQTAIKEREAQLAQAINELRKPWRADTASGVAELSLDRLTIWLTAAHSIEVDTEYENELGTTARREIPIRVVFLNDTFLPVTPEAAAGLTPMHWAVEVQNAAGATLRAWPVEESAPRALQPAERRDFQLTWDGRDADGGLLAPGDYAIAIKVNTAAGDAQQTLPVRIVDSGPLEIVEVDATTQYIRNQEAMMRWHQTLQEGMRLLDQMRFQNFGR